MADLIKSITGSPLLAVYGCFFAFFFGIAHTFLPGHGKTIVCGYCVGRKRDVPKIFFVSGVTVVTHLFSSAALGALAMTTSHVLVRNIILPKLQLISAAILLVFGAVLFISRRLGAAGHIHSHGDHVHDHHGQDHPENHGHVHHGEGDGHTHGRMDSLLRECLAGPQPSFHRYLHLFWLGLAAGLIPCVEPFTLMLFAISLGRIALGFLLLACFGLGIFATMVVLGLLVTSTGLDPGRGAGRPLMAAAQKGAAGFKAVYPLILMGLGAAWIYVALKR